MKKLCETRGETLVECLAALLVLLLAVSILGGYVRTAGVLYAENGRKREEYYHEISRLEALEGEALMSRESILEISAEDESGRYRVIDHFPVILYYGDHVAAYVSDGGT